MLKMLVKNEMWKTLVFWWRKVKRQAGALLLNEKFIIAFVKHA